MKGFKTEEFEQLYGELPVNMPSIKIVLTDNMYNDSLVYTQEFRKKDVIENKSFIETMGGSTIIPNSINDDFYVLIDKRLTGLELAETLYHEFTHCFDYVKLASRAGIVSYDNMKSLDYINMFYLWSEYNGKRVGCECTIDIKIKQGISNEDLCKNIADEMDIYIKDSIQRYMSVENINRMYNFMHFFGFVSACRRKAPGSISDALILQRLGDNQWLHDLYLFIKDKNTFDTIYDNLGYMKRILSSHFIFVN